MQRDSGQVIYSHLCQDGQAMSLTLFEWILLDGTYRKAWKREIKCPNCAVGISIDPFIKMAIEDQEGIL